jgi:hypothetical protein
LLNVASRLRRNRSASSGSRVDASGHPAVSRSMISIGTVGIGRASLYQVLGQAERLMQA